MSKKTCYLSINYVTAMIICLVSLAGCGQTGPLYLPDKTPQITQNIQTE